MSTILQTQTKAASNPSFTPTHPGLLQRKCSNDECTERHKKRLMLQRRSTSETEYTEVPPIVHEVLRSPGQPLDAATRTFIEPHLGHDFSRVRVHTDAKAAESARDVNANAYTVGRDIVFGVGQFAPETHAGRGLLAHELAHILQQTNGTAAGAERISDPSDPVEQDADRAASNVMAGRKADVKTAVNGGTLHRWPWGEEEVLIPELKFSSPEEETSMKFSGSAQETVPPPKLPCPRPNPAAKCQDGFTLIQRATWLHCGESPGTQFPGCSFCNKGEQEKHCEKILDLLGTHRVIAPVAGRCGDKFQITTPRLHAPIIPVVKAEKPGGDTKLDINQDVIRELGLDMECGRYDVCLKGPIGHDDRLVPTGGSACQKPKKQPEKTKEKKEKE